MTTVKHEFVFGELRITVEAPAGFPLDLSPACHAHNADEFRAIVATVGGMSQFEDVKTDRYWIDLPAQMSGAVECDLTVFVPNDMVPAVASPAMAALRAEQQAEEAA